MVVPFVLKVILMGFCLSALVNLSSELTVIGDVTPFCPCNCTIVDNILLILYCTSTIMASKTICDANTHNCYSVCLIIRLCGQCARLLLFVSHLAPLFPPLGKDNPSFVKFGGFPGVSSTGYHGGIYMEILNPGTS